MLAHRCQELVDFAKDKEKGYVGMTQRNGRNAKCLVIIPISSMGYNYL